MDDGLPLTAFLKVSRYTFVVVRPREISQRQGGQGVHNIFFISFVTIFLKMCDFCDFTRE